MKKYKLSNICYLTLMISTGSFGSDIGPGYNLFKNDLDKAPLSSSSLLERTAIEFSLGTDNQNISTEISKPFGNHIWSIKLSAPVERVNKNGTLPNLDGLSNAISAAVNYKRVIGNPTVLKDITSQLIKRDEVCENVAQIRGLRDRSLFTGDNCTDDDNVALFRITDDEAEILGSDTEAAKLKLRELENQYDCIMWTGRSSGNCKKTIGIFSLGAALGTEEFEYFDSSTFKESSSDKSQFSLEALYSVIRIPSDWVYRVGYTYQDVYESTADEIFCDTSSGANPVTCNSGALGAPNKNKKNILNFEIRRLFNNVGIAPKLSYDFENKTTGFDLPIFLTRDNEGQLTGGINIGWIDEEDNSDFVVGLFLGRAFKFLE